MRYTIIFSPQAEEDLLALRAHERAKVVDAIECHGVPAGMLIGFEDPDDWWEELLLRNPRLQERIEQARQNIREGKGITLEELRKKHNIPAQSASEEGVNKNDASQETDQPEPPKRRRVRNQSKAGKASGAST